MNNTNQRYWVFGGSQYYPSGGMEDFLESFETYARAENCARRYLHEGQGRWTYVWDTVEQTIIYKKG